MTPETLLGLPKPLEELTDAELTAHLARYWPATRPKKPANFVIARAAATASADDGSLSPIQLMIKNSLAARGMNMDGSKIKPKMNLTRK